MTNDMNRVVFRGTLEIPGRTADVTIEQELDDVKTIGGVLDTMASIVASGGAALLTAVDVEVPQ